MAKILDGIQLKKKFGQHFLKEQWVVDKVLANVDLNNASSIFEIGPGAGFLTKSILNKNIGRLWVFEIDPEWVSYLQKNVNDKRLKIFHENILDVNFQIFEENQPWILLANLPYQITFPILFLLQKNMHLLKEGVLMVQEEVAQKIMKISGRDYGFISLFFQYYFELKLLDKIPPTAFNPPPKIHSRLLYFKPKFQRIKIDDEEKFWKFIKIAFKSPRRTLKNNLQSAQYDLNQLSPDTLQLRAQQIDFNGFLQIWNKLNKEGLI